MITINIYFLKLFYDIVNVPLKIYTPYSNKNDYCFVFFLYKWKNDSVIFECNGVRGHCFCQTRH